MLAQADAFEQTERLCHRFLAVPPEHLDLRKRQIAKHAHVWKEFEVLKHHTDARTKRR